MIIFTYNVSVRIGAVRGSIIDYAEGVHWQPCFAPYALFNGANQLLYLHGNLLFLSSAC